VRPNCGVTTTALPQLIINIINNKDTTDNTFPNIHLVAQSASRYTAAVNNAPQHTNISANIGLIHDSIVALLNGFLNNPQKLVQQLTIAQKKHPNINI
jgi:hypothetical protein